MSSEKPRSRLGRSLSASRFSGGGEKERRLLQERLALFGRVGFILVLSIEAAKLLLFAGLRPNGLDEWAATAPFECGALLPLLTVWIACRRGERPHSFLNLCDYVGTAAVTFLLALAARRNPSLLAAAIPVHSLTNVLVFRAIIVPSTPRLTLGVGTVATGIVLVAVFAPLGFLPALENAYAEVGTILQWVVGALALSTVTSWIIFGLRKQVAAAMQLGQYRLEKLLGQGGMGQVYKASHAMLRRETAVKLLLPELSDEQSMERFEAEVQHTAALSHPNTIAIYDYGHTHEGIFYYAMEFLNGLDLGDLVMQHGPQPPGRVAHLLRQAAASLAEAHSVGLVHRDIKPANIMLTRRGGVPDFVKVVDFGLVRQIGATEKAAGGGLEPLAADLTDHGMIVGTPHYISPEAVRGEAVGPPADIYALGGVGFFLLTGSHVFSGPDAMALCRMQLTATPVRPSERLGQPIPADLEDVILRCLAKDPADRPGSARELEEALAACECSRDESWTRRDAEIWWGLNDPARNDGLPASMLEPVDLSGELSISRDLYD